MGGYSVTTIVLGFGAFSTPLILGIMAGVGDVGGIISESLVLGLIKKKIELFKKKIDHIQEYISKSWFLFEKIRGDGIITLQELDEFRKLMDQYEKGLNIEDDSKDKEYIKVRETLKHQVEKEVKKEVEQQVKEDLKNELKEEIKNIYRNKLFMLLICCQGKRFY